MEKTRLHQNEKFVIYTDCETNGNIAILFYRVSCLHAPFRSYVIIIISEPMGAP